MKLDGAQRDSILERREARVSGDRSAESTSLLEKEGERAKRERSINREERAARADETKTGIAMDDTTRFATTAAVRCEDDRCQTDLPHGVAP